MTAPRFKSSTDSQQACPCGSGQALSACCGHWHVQRHQQVYAPDAATLMRSRYSAYVLGAVDYLLATWHPSTAPGGLELAAVRWLGLELRHFAARGDAAVVEFVARFRQDGRGQRLHEVSRFVREDGRWWYVDGQFPDV